MYSLCKQTTYTARVDVHSLRIHVHVHVQTTYDVVFFAARSIAEYLSGNQCDQQIRNCDKKMRGDK